MRVSWPEPDAADVRGEVPGGEQVSAPVAEILAAVRSGGDAQVREYTRRFDTGGRAEPRTLRVGAEELAGALAGLDPAVRAGLEVAAENVRLVAEAALREPRQVKLPQGHTVLLREEPVARAAVYVPGGRAPYPSTVVMGVVTARAAGVSEVALCAPPGPDGELHPAIAAAAALAGADEVYRMGGAQAIAALAFGTETVPAVDVIVGPGNLYVQEAKRQVSGVVGIDGFAGPSDLVVLAGAGADPDLVAADLAAQAEHGEGSAVLAVSPDRDLLARVEEVLAALDTPAQAFLVAVESVEEGLAFAEAYAPEHLELVGEGAEALAPQVRRAGCLFVGAEGATAFGDYVAGSNHVLPTGGSARFASGLGPGHFRRRLSEVRIGGAAAELAAAGAPIARAEGFERHAASMEARVRENPRP
ncbi:MAG: histidinol dehydrogenase [Solirubrobacterales bacterium]|nr:histidinol dehydrogenase [Solirubrobacterales bacterium]